MPDVKEILQSNRILDSQNSNWRMYHKDVADFCMPRKAWQTTIRQTGNRLDFGFLYDSLAITALKTMVAGFHSNFTNPSSRWFGFEARSLAVRQDRQAVIWFKDVEDALYQILSNTNFYPVAKEFYYDAGGLGTGIFFSEADPKKVIRYREIPLHECNLEEDANGEVNGVYWKFRLTATQAWRLWGDKAGKTVLEFKSGDKAFEQLEFLLYVGPRAHRDVTKMDKLNMPFTSCWIAVKDAHLIDEGGFEEFPFHVGRWWKDANDCFGYSPAMDALADIKLRNAQKKTALRRAMKETDPPLDVPSKGYVLPLNLNPAAMNYRDAKMTAEQGVRAFAMGNGNFQIAKEMMEDVKVQIEDAFYLPLFRALSRITKQMTVPEVQERIREGMIQLGPVVGNFTPTFAGALVRAFNIAYRAGELPPPPPSLEGEDFDVVFLSPLVRAQREAEMQSIQLFWNDVAGIARVKPEVLDNVNEDATVEIIAKIRAIHPEIVRSKREVAEIRENRAKQQQMAAELDAAHKVAAIEETGANARKAMVAA